MRSEASTVDAYIAGLSAEHRDTMKTLRDLVRTHLPPGYAEAMAWGMPAYEVPLARYPDTYNGQALMYVAFATQKSNYALYLTCVYGDAGREKILRDGFVAIGRKPDMGKSCIRFKTLADIPLDAIATLIGAIPVEVFIARHEAVHGARAAERAKKPAAGKAKSDATAAKKKTTAKASPARAGAKTAAAKGARKSSSAASPPRTAAKAATLVARPVSETTSKPAGKPPARQPFAERRAPAKRGVAAKKAAAKRPPARSPRA